MQSLKGVMDTKAIFHWFSQPVPLYCMHSDFTQKKTKKNDIVKMYDRISETERKEFRLWIIILFHDTKWSQDCGGSLFGLCNTTSLQMITNVTAHWVDNSIFCVKFDRNYLTCHYFQLRKMQQPSIFMPRNCLWLLSKKCLVTDYQWGTFIVH